MSIESKRKRILIVDDEPDILEFLQIVLQEEGYIAVTTDQGEYLEKLDINILPNIILLDILLSGMDGREIVKRLKQQEETKHIPVIMLSAQPNAEQTVEEAGAEDFVAKPFDIDFLLKKIEQYL